VSQRGTPLLRRSRATRKRRAMPLQSEPG
jgi:hypothetical protein